MSRRSPPLTDDDIFEMFSDAIDLFPADVQEQARDWLHQRHAAHRLVVELQEKGLSALLPDDGHGTD